MLAVLLAESFVYAHMFLYCDPAVNAATVGVSAFMGSCLPSSTFLYLTSLLPLVMVIVLVRKSP